MNFILGVVIRQISPTTRARLTLALLKILCNNLLDRNVTAKRSFKSVLFEIIRLRQRDLP